MTTFAEHIIVAGVKNRNPMLEKSMYNSWASRIRLFIKEKKHAQQIQDDCDVQAINIMLHILSPDVYALVNHQEAAKDIWDRGETLYEYYWRLSQLINDMHTIGMTMQQVQVNTKFLNALPLEWSKFVTDVKLAKSLYTTNYDHHYAYLSQHERHANEVRIMHERYSDPLALVANSQTLYNPSQSPQHSVSHFYISARKESDDVSTKKWHSYLLWHQAFQTEDLDAYDSDYDDISSARAVLMANLSSCDSDVFSEESQNAGIQDTNSSALND
ncbi:hypothetical protein Tco_0632283 [Tanacetum coccineum]